MRKILNKFGAFLLGTIIFWTVVFVSYEIWIELQPEGYRYGIKECDPKSGTEKIVWMDEKPEEKQKKEAYYLENVEEFGPLKIGGKAPKGIVLRPLESIPDSEFYVFVNRMGFGMCNNDSCDIFVGRVVKCMGGWLAGDDQPESSYEVGLSNEDVKKGKASMVVISNKKSEIIGIYPNHAESDIIHILGQYPEYEESLSKCIEANISTHPPAP